MCELDLPAPKSPMADYREGDKHTHTHTLVAQTKALFCITNYDCWKEACMMRLRRQFIAKVTNPVFGMAQMTSLKCQKTAL